MGGGLAVVGAVVDEEDAAWVGDSGGGECVSVGVGVGFVLAEAGGVEGVRCANKPKPTKGYGKLPPGAGLGDRLHTVPRGSISDHAIRVCSFRRRSDSDSAATPARARDADAALVVAVACVKDPSMDLVAGACSFRRETGFDALVDEIPCFATDVRDALIRRRVSFRPHTSGAIL